MQGRVKSFDPKKGYGFITTAAASGRLPFRNGRISPRGSGTPG